MSGGEILGYLIAAGFVAFVAYKIKQSRDKKAVDIKPPDSGADVSPK